METAGQRQGSSMEAAGQRHRSRVAQRGRDLYCSVMKWALRHGSSLGASAAARPAGAESQGRTASQPARAARPGRAATQPARAASQGRAAARPAQAVAPGQARAATPRRRTPSADGQERLAEMVGPVTESREAHLARHGGGWRSCPRCRWYLHGHHWMASYGAGGGSVPSGPGVGPRQRVVWISERPARWGGSWALGCVFCADAAARSKFDGTASASTPRRLGSSWARYSVCPATLQAEHVKQHAHYDSHKIAERAYYRPDEPLKLTMQASQSDDRLLAGAVPQAEDWLRAWHSARTPQSWKTAAETVELEQYIHQIRDRPGSVRSRGLRCMAELMREVVRRQKRQWIRDCTTIALSLDDRQGFKLVRFRCDAPFESAGAERQGLAALAETQGLAALAETQGKPWREGIVGCFDCAHAATLSDLAEDYAVRTTEQVVKLVRAFCDDEDLAAMFLKRVKIVVADGALQKVGHVMKSTSMTSIVMVARDPAHMVRIACREPLIRTGRFEAQHKRLFGDRHALIKDFQHSETWQARLEDCQRLIVSMDGAQGGGVKHILRHFSYAPQRFESWADPRRKYVCALNAIALTLADVAGDARQPPSVRARAETCLDAMTARDILEAGIAADFGEVCMRSAHANMKHNPHAALAETQGNPLPAPPRAGVDVVYVFRYD